MKKIAIAGGGPGGLTLARLLQVNNFEVTVYERDTHRGVRVQGATLDLHQDTGLAALRAAGLMDAFNAAYRPGADRMRVVDRDARVHYEDAFEGDRPEIDRGPLRDLLLDSLKPDTVAWNRQCVSLTPNGAGWTLHFQDGSAAEADLVVVADGASSRLRPYVTPIKPIYSGYAAVEGAVYEGAPRMSALVNGGKVFALADSKTLIVGAKGDGSLAFYAAFAAPGNASFTGTGSAWFQQTFPGWDPVWLELFDKGPLTPRPFYYMPLDQSWPAHPNITLIGDAAHLIPPYAGEGVNMAMLDALQLATHLTHNPDAQQAIAAYESAMLPRAAATAADTLDQTAWMHAPGALERMVRMFR